MVCRSLKGPCQLQVYVEYWFILSQCFYTHFQQVDSTSTVNRRRISTASSIYSRRPMSTAEYPSKSPAEESSSDRQRVQFEDNPALRASLLPYQEWWAFMQSTHNPFMEDSLNDEQPYVPCDAPATPIHRPPARASHRTSSVFSFPQRNSFQPLNINNSNISEPASDECLSTPPSPASSEATITPTRFHFMEESSNNSPREVSADLGVNSTGVEEVSDFERKGNPTPPWTPRLDCSFELREFREVSAIGLFGNQLGTRLLR